MNLITYFRDTVSELKAVRWPTPAETFRLSAIVIAVSLVVAIYVGSLDFLFTNLITLIIK